MTDPYDDNGWLIGAVTPLDVSASYSLLAPEPGSVLRGEQLRHQAQRFFRIDLEMLTTKRYPGGGFPRSDRALFRIRRDADVDVEVITVPADDAPAVMRHARETANAVGAGLDVLVGRATRVWQVPAGDAHALALVTVLASVLLAPVLPPEGDTVFGVKTARMRLEALGWRT